MIASQPSVQTVSFYVNGQWEDAGGRRLMPVTNPATGAEIAQVAYATAEDVDRVVASCARRLSQVAGCAGGGSGAAAVSL